MIDFIELACATCGHWSDFERKPEASLAVTAGLVSVVPASHAGLSGKDKTTVDSQDHD